MKRPSTQWPVSRSGHVKADLSTNQLASIGAVAVAFNEAELLLDLMISVCLGFRSTNLAADINSRINGADGKIEIIKSALAELGAPEAMRILLAEVLGKNGFGDLKAYRDAIIHARIIDSDLGIGLSVPKRGKFTEILLTQEALDGVFDRLTLLREELIGLIQSMVPLVLLSEQEQADRVTGGLGGLFAQGNPPSHKRKEVERRVEASMSLIREHQTRRLSLPPLPEFPERPEARPSLGVLGSATEPQPQ
jgi:hypothetical protein